MESFSLQIVFMHILLKKVRLILLLHIAFRVVNILIILIEIY